MELPDVLGGPGGRRCGVRMIRFGAGTARDKVLVVATPEEQEIIELLTRKAANDEREACAQVAEGDTARADFPWCGDVREIAALIRARGQS